jgi:hypothetical protein
LMAKLHFVWRENRTFWWANNICLFDSLSKHVRADSGFVWLNDGIPPEDQTFSNITRAVSTQPSNLWILYNLGSMIWAIAIPKQIKKCLQEVVADISIYSNILIHFSRFPTFLYIYILVLGLLYK